MNDRTQRRKQAEQNRLYLIIGAGIAGAVLLLCVCGGVGLVVIKGGAGNAAVAVGARQPTADKEGADWTVDELFNYLKAKGVVVRKENNRDGFFIGESRYFFTSSGSKFYVVEMAGTANAQRMSGASFTWGRFAFVTEDDATEKAVRNVLLP